MTRTLKTLVLLLVAGIAVSPCWAWSSKTQSAVVSSAMRLLASDAGVPISNLKQDVLRGAEASNSQLNEILKDYDASPARAIESDMYLLQAVLDRRVDPYFAYRLGVLGKAVAQATSPLAELDSSERKQYERDAERSVEEVQLKSVARRHVDPRVYFDQLRQEMAPREELIIRDYESGLGFEGVAHAALSDDFSRSVNAVADVWHTVLTASAEVANIGKPRFREYLVDAIGFYIDRGNKQETQHAFNRLVSLGLDSPDIRKQIADAYYDAGDFEEAIKAYKEILDIEPSRRDVVERIASYYMEQGDKALENGKLEESLSAYTEAAEADRLNTDAQAKRLEVEALLAARDARLTGAQSNLTAAQTLEDRAEEQSQAGDYPKAMDLLQQAKDLYDSVPPEFPTEYSLARARLTGVNQRMQQHQREFLSNAARLSGTGFATDARYRAATTQAGISEEDLRSIVSEQYTEEAQRLSREYQQSGAME